MKRSKYGAQKTEYDGIVFDSRHEAMRWRELALLQRAGEITDLQRQVKYILVPAQKDESGKIAERAVSYVADFVYRDARSGEVVVEDAKGMHTREYIIKRKLMLYVHGIRIREV